MAVNNLPEADAALMDKTFRESLLRHLNLNVIRRVITLPLVKDSNGKRLETFYPGNGTWEPLDDYGYYLDILHVDDSKQKARDLGIAAAACYGSLVQNAAFKGRKTVVDLLENNLRFNYVISGGPSVADPLASNFGWVSFRFSFASSTTVPTSFSTLQKTLQELEKVQK